MFSTVRIFDLNKLKRLREGRPTTNTHVITTPYPLFWPAPQGSRAHDEGKGGQEGGQGKGGQEGGQGKGGQEGGQG